MAKVKERDELAPAVWDDAITTPHVLQCRR